MDCPSEEHPVRLKLGGIAEIQSLDYDIPKRQLTVHHDGRLDEIENSISDLSLGGKLVITERTDDAEFGEPAKQRKLLWKVVGINFGFFLAAKTFRSG